MLSGRDASSIPAKAGEVAHHIPRNARVLSELGLVEKEERHEDEADDQRGEDLRRVPGESDAAEGQSGDCERGTCNDDEVAAALQAA